METEYKFAITKWGEGYEKITMGGWEYLEAHAPDGYTTIATNLTEEEVNALGKVLGCADNYTWKKVWNK